MVYKEAARKTALLMAAAGIMSLGVLTFIAEPSASPTARAVTASEVLGANWLVFVLGIFIGTLMLGTYFYLGHLEAGREE